MFRDQRDFMQKAGQFIDNFSPKQVAMYETLIREETDEFFAAEEPVEKLKEAIDILVVVMGYLISWIGYRASVRAWNMVWVSNMDKLVGGVIVREDGKIMKNEKYRTESKAKLMSGLGKLLD